MIIKESKALARKTLIGKFGTVIAANIIYALIMVLYVALMIFGLYLCVAYAPFDLNLGFLHQAATRNVAISLGGLIAFTAGIILMVVFAIWFEIGEKKLLINICRGEKYSVGNIFYGFTSAAHPWRYFGAVMIKSLVIWALTVIPTMIGSVSTLISLFMAGDAAGVATAHIGNGIMRWISIAIQLVVTMFLFFTEILLVDGKSETILDAFKDSIALTKGHKLDILWLSTFSFLLWGLLCAVCPLAALWVNPYIECTGIIFYLICRGEGSLFEDAAPSEPEDGSFAEAEADASGADNGSFAADANGPQGFAETAADASGEENAPSAEAAAKDLSVDADGSSEEADPGSQPSSAKDPAQSFEEAAAECGITGYGKED